MTGELPDNPTNWVESLVEDDVIAMDIGGCRGINEPDESLHVQITGEPREGEGRRDVLRNIRVAEEDARRIGLKALNGDVWASNEGDLHLSICHEVTDLGGMVAKEYTDPPVQAVEMADADEWAGQFDDQ